MRLLSTHHVLSRVHNAVYHEISRQKSFVVFYMSAKLLYENLRWRYSDMDLRESMWDSTKVFFANVYVYNLLQNFSASKLS